ncbi:MAG: hypothetical protein VX015_09750 [Planctomycetota bacterium]|nr:hypothetical protein [Planctomycetota bacterium]MEC8512417.1 hypothetical protein [Planctomycetota bacterium]
MPDRSPAPALVRPRGHEEVLAGLAESARQGTLPHALLFTGEEGVGKYRAAVWLAATLLCERGGSSPCLECGSCLRVQRGSHADVFVVDHQAHGQNAITVDFIAARESRSREAYQGPPVEAFLALRSAEGRGKFVIVREAESMLEEAQNAFLKTLEEPRPGVHILLECSSPGSLLATVRSRVVSVGFGSPGPDACARILLEQGALGPDMDRDELESLVRLAGGSPGLALRLHARAAPRMQALLGAAFCGDRSRAEVAMELFDLDGDFPGKTASAQRRTRARTILDLGLEVLADVERAAAGGDPAQLAHGATASRIAAAPFGRSRERRRAAADGWLAAREDLNLNLSPEALVERALASIGRP